MMPAKIGQWRFYIVVWGEEKNFSLNIPNFCDYFVKKVVSEIRKCHQLQRDEVTPDNYMLAQAWSLARLFQNYVIILLRN